MFSKTVVMAGRLIFVAALLSVFGMCRYSIPVNTAFAQPVTADCPSVSLR